MNRRILSVLMLAIIAAPVAISTANAKGGMPRRVTKRTVEAGYNYVASSNEQPLEYNLAEPMEVAVERNERWASISIEDATGRSVGAEVTQDVDGDGTADLTWDVCEQSRSPLTIAPKRALTITMVSGLCPGEPANGTATSGTVYVELYSPAPKLPTPPKVERTLEFSYMGWLYEAPNQIAFGSYGINTALSEVYVDLQATDTSGLPAHLYVYPQYGRSFEVCGSTEKPVAIEPGGEIRVSVYPTPCADGTPAAMTTGSIEVTLSNVP